MTNLYLSFVLAVLGIGLGLLTLKLIVSFFRETDEERVTRIMDEDIREANGEN